jgi:hypothetical protein
MILLKHKNGQAEKATVVTVGWRAEAISILMNLTSSNQSYVCVRFYLCFLSKTNL